MMTNRLLLITLLPFLLGAAPLQNSEQMTDDLSAFFRVIWSLLIVLAIMLVLYALLKKRFSVIGKRPGKSIRVLEIQPIMPKKSLCLVEVKGKEILLGIGNEDITFLTSLDKSSNQSFQDILDSSEQKVP